LLYDAQVAELFDVLQGVGFQCRLPSY